MVVRELGLRSWVVAALMGLTACASAPVEKKVVEREKASAEDIDDILDAPVEGASKRPMAAAAELQRMELPETPSAPSRDVDGAAEDWEKKSIRIFKDKGQVESGERFWTGAGDLSFRVGVHADAGYLYFLVDVTDDRVLSNDDDGVTDGVVLTIRDPNLDNLVKSAPENMRLQEMVKAETSLVFLPDGRFRRYRSDEGLPDNMGVVAVAEKKNGYVVEIAFQIEAFEQVAAIPLQDIAFRVDVLDGDEAEREGTQTVMSTLPDRGNDDPRMAIYPVGGLLPHYPVSAAPPRKNAIGSWQVEDKAWAFRPFEVVSRLWVTVDDARAFEEALRSSDVLKELCKSSRKDVRLIDSYQSRGGGYRAGLVLCGDRAVNGKCPEGSRSELFWVMLKPKGEAWKLETVVSAFDEELTQCATAASGEEPFYHRFSLFPMDMVNDATWAVGWTRTAISPGLDEEKTGISILNVSKTQAFAGSAVTNEKRSTSDQRVRTAARVYLTRVDDDEHLDLCQIEDYHEQYCSGLDRGCKTMEHGRSVMTTVQLYNPRTKRFEKYELSKHPGCPADLDFTEREGYLLLQTKGRVGFLPSPKLDEEVEGLDIF